MNFESSKAVLQSFVEKLVTESSMFSFSLVDEPDSLGSLLMSLHEYS